MNVLFVYSLEYGLSKNGLLDLQEFMPFGISYISSFLHEHGHNTEVAIIGRLLGQKTISILNEHITRFEPKLVCFTAVATEYNFIANAAKYIKDHYPNIFLLIGGAHASLNPEEVMKADFDALCVGEGELPTLELVTQLDKTQAISGIPNLCIKHGFRIEKNAPREFLQELDSLPFPDRDMWQKWMSQKDPERCSILLSRGCPFDCSYCCNHSFRKIAQGAYVRLRSPKNIIEEINEISLRFHRLKEIYFETESIALNMEWCLNLCSELEHLNATLKRPLSFGASIRIIPNIELGKIFVALKKANFRFVNIGLESGSERVRREILRRDYSNGDIINAVKLARKHGLQIAIFNLIGIPGEALNDFKETIKINRICKPDWHFTSIFYPYPGTDLHLLCKNQGLLQKTLNPRFERRRAILDLPGFSRKKIQESYLFFDRYIYDGFNPEDGLLIRIIDFFYMVYRSLAHIPLLKYMLSPVRKYIGSRIRKRNYNEATSLF